MAVRQGARVPSTAYFVTADASFRINPEKKKKYKNARRSATTSSLHEQDCLFAGVWQDASLQEKQQYSWPLPDVLVIVNGPRGKKY